MSQSASEPSLPDTVEIRRSSRRRRSVSARVEADRVVVLMPAGLSRATEEEHVDRLLGRLRDRQQRRRLQQVDLHGRAHRLSERYLDGVARPVSVSWVTNQRQRWGSCSVHEGRIRLSSSLEGAPDWVVDAVLLHELAHLLVADHGPGFQALVQRYPRYERAQGFLDGLSWAGSSGGRAPGPDRPA